MAEPAARHHARVGRSLAPREPAHEQSGPEAFFAAVAGTFERAVRKGPSAETRDYLIAHRLVRLRFAGGALIPIVTPALDHLRADGAGEPALTVCLWDGATTGAGMPPLPWSTLDYRPHGEIAGYSTERFRTSVNLGARQLSAIDLDRGLAFSAIADPALVPFAERGSPLLRIFHWWMERHRRQLIHAAAVGNRRGGVLLAGRGGSGKSSTALTCLGSELAYVGDDYCLLGLETEPRVYSLFNSGKVALEDRAHFPALTPAAASDGKALFFIERLRPDALLPECPVSAVVLPEVGAHARTSLRPVSALTALRELAPSTIFQLSRSGEQAFRAISRLVKQVPCYRLELGPDRSSIPAVLTGLLPRGSA